MFSVDSQHQNQLVGSRRRQRRLLQWTKHRFQHCLLVVDQSSSVIFGRPIHANGNCLGVLSVGHIDKRGIALSV